MLACLQKHQLYFFSSGETFGKVYLTTQLKRSLVTEAPSFFDSFPFVFSYFTGILRTILSGSMLPVIWFDFPYNSCFMLCGLRHPKRECVTAAENINAVWSAKTVQRKKYRAKVRVGNNHYITVENQHSLSESRQKPNFTTLTSCYLSKDPLSLFCRMFNKYPPKIN